MQKVLVVDDEELLTRTFSKLIAKNGYDVYVASRGEDAEVMAEEEDFDLILSDIRMPGKNGLETVEAINSAREKNGKEPIPFIFLTGFADEALEKKAKSMGPVAFFKKPFDASKLIDQINEELSS